MAIDEMDRCFFLAQCYVAVKRYGEALTLIQHATLHVRETRSVLATLAGINTPADTSYPLAVASVDVLDSTVSTAAADTKNEWFAYNGGTLEGDPKTYKKPLFFDIGLNYVQLDMERLMQRAGKAPPTTAREERESVSAPPGKSRLEEVARPETPEAAPAKGGLGSLLGGWWGRK
jgi:signal recognition particle subunit SRP68